MRKTLLVVITAACGSSVSLSDLANQLHQAQCTNLVACGIQPDQATCLASTSFYSSDFILTTIADAQSGKIKYDGGEAASCVSEIKNAPCTFTGFNTTASDPCNKMFTGTVATGAACIEGSECVNGDICVFPSTCTDPTNTCCSGAMAGKCTARNASGATCAADAECADGLYCSDPMFTGTGTCKAQATTAGATCDTSVFGACANPFYCNINFNTTPATGTCKTPPAHGAACSTMDDLQCSDFRDYCDATSLKCTSRIAIGMACTVAAGNCVGDALCDSTTNKCVALVGANAACTVDANGGSNCLGDTTCMSGTTACTTGMTGCTCVLPAAGMACH